MRVYKKISAWLVLWIYAMPAIAQPAQPISGYPGVDANGISWVIVSGIPVPYFEQASNDVYFVNSVRSVQNSGGSGSQTPWTSDIAGAGHSLTGVNVINATTIEAGGTNLYDLAISTTNGFTWGGLYYPATGNPSNFSTNAIIGTSFPPSLPFGIFYAFHNFASIPNSSAYTMPPGAFFNNSPLTMGTLAYSFSANINWMGDSRIYGAGLSGAPNAPDGVVNKVSGLIQWGFSNRGLDGAILTDMVNYVFNDGCFGSGGPNMNMIDSGINDLRTYPDALPDYTGCLMAYLAYIESATTQKAQASTSTGSWSASTFGTIANIQMSTTTSNSPITFTNICGSTIYVGMTHESNSLAFYKIVIDGVTNGPYSSSETSATYLQPGSSIAYCHRFAGLIQTNHAVQVMKSVGGNAAQVNLLFVASNDHPLIYQNVPWIGNRTYILGIGRMTGAGYVTWGGSDSTVYAWNNAQKYVCKTLADLDGLAVDFVDINAACDPNLFGNMQSDGLHETGQGYTLWADKIYDAIRTDITPRERNIVHALAPLVSFDTNNTATFSGNFAGGGSGLTDINSNSLDAPTKAQLALAGSAGGGGNAIIAGQTSTIRNNFLDDPSSASTINSGTAYFVYFGLIQTNTIFNHLSAFLTGNGSGAQTAEMGLFTTTSPPNGGPLVFAKLTASGSVSALAGNGTSCVVTNTAAFNQTVTAGTYLWGGIRIAMASAQPAVNFYDNDLGTGNAQQTGSAGALTGTGPWTGSIISVTTVQDAPVMFITTY